MLTLRGQPFGIGNAVVNPVDGRNTVGKRGGSYAGKRKQEVTSSACAVTRISLARSLVPTTKADNAMCSACFAISATFKMPLVSLLCPDRHLAVTAVLSLTRQHALR